MLINKLQLTTKNWISAYIASPCFRKTITTTHINIRNDNVPSNRNLGIVFDQHMNFEEHINYIRRSCFQHLKGISDIHHGGCRKAAGACFHITSRLDNGISLLYGLSTSTISHLQKIQNSAARLITSTRKFDSITPWSAAKSALAAYRKKNHFKINVLTFRAMHGTAPQYPRQHHSSGPPVAMSGKKRPVDHQWHTGGNRRVRFATDGHWWPTSGPPPANYVTGWPPAISSTSVWWATTGKQWYLVVGHR